MTLTLLLAAVPAAARDYTAVFTLEAGAVRKSLVVDARAGEAANAALASSDTLHEALTLTAKVDPGPAAELLALDYNIEWTRRRGRSAPFRFQARNRVLVRPGEDRLVADFDGRAQLTVCVRPRASSTACLKARRQPVGDGALRYTSLLRRGKYAWMLEVATTSGTAHALNLYEEEAPGVSFGLRATPHDGGFALDYGVSVLPIPGLPEPARLENSGRIDAPAVVDTQLAASEGFEARIRIAPD